MTNDSSNRCEVCKITFSCTLSLCRKKAEIVVSHKGEIHTKIVSVSYSELQFSIKGWLEFIDNDCRDQLASLIYRDIKRLE